MTYREIYRAICRAHKRAEEKGWRYIGVRHEQKKREVGDICNNSRHNPDRDDEREFPEYGTPEYENLPELDGTSAWEGCEKEGIFEGLFVGIQDWDDEPWHDDHIYLVVGDEQTVTADRDYDEIIIKNAQVFEVIR